MGAAQTHKLLKKLDQNFRALVQCEHCAFDRRAQELWQKNNPQFQSFLKDGGMGEEKLFSKSFLPRFNIN